MVISCSCVFVEIRMTRSFDKCESLWGLFAGSIALHLLIPKLPGRSHSRLRQGLLLFKAAYRYVSVGRLNLFHSSNPPSNSMTGKSCSAKYLAAEAARWQTSE